MKRLLPFFMSVVIVAGPVFSWAAVESGTVIGSTASPTVVSGTASSGAVTATEGIRVQPVFNDDTSNDDIIQLNNLRIQSIDTQTDAAVIRAANDFGVNCARFTDQYSTAGVSYPCPMPATILYQIKVDSDTRLLLRNRKKATLADFAVGDRINVYGFMDRDNNAVTALIVRNIDKPAVKKYLQLNNVQVLTRPDSLTSPASFVVVQNGISPCLDYGESGAGGKLFPCPMGLEMREAKVNMGMPIIQGSVGGALSTAPTGVSGSGPVTLGAPSTVPTMPMYYPLARKFLINVTADTKIIGSNRQPLTLADIAVGDTLNIYGSQSGTDSTSINALVIRDLSKPITNERAVLRVAVTAADMMCMWEGSQKDAPSSIMAPCGILYNASVELYDSNGNGFNGKKASTERGVAVFENLKPGTYTVAAVAPGYAQNKLANIVLGARQIQTVTVSLQPINSAGLSITAEYPQSGPIGTQVTLTGTGFSTDIVYPSCPPPPTTNTNTTCETLPAGFNTVHFGPATIENVTSYDGKTLYFSVPDGYSPPCTSSGGCTGMYGLISPGNYNVYVTNDNGTSNSISFTVTSGTSQQSIQVLSPNGGETWTKGTTQTIKWQDNTPYPQPLPGSLPCAVGMICPIAISLVPRIYDIKLVPYYTPCTGTICPMYPILSPYTVAKNVSATSYIWSVGRVAELYDFVPDSSYTVQVCQSGTTICDSSDSYFKIISTSSGNLPPVISGISGPTALKLNEVGTWTVKAYDPDPSGTILNYSVSWGDSGTTGQGVTAPAEIHNLPTATFTHSYALAGNYTVTFTVSDNVGATAKGTVTVAVSQTSPAPSITVLSPNGGDMWKIGSAQSISWNSTNAPSGSWVALFLTNGPVIAQGLPVGGSYSWNVPSEFCSGDVCGAPMQVRSDYKIEARLYTGPALCTGLCPSSVSQPTLITRDYSDAPFSIVSAASAPQLFSIAPAWGSIGTKATLKGAGFSKTSNAINFGSGYLPNISSADGSTLVFAVPDYLSPACSYATPPCMVPVLQTLSGEYRVTVTTDGGTSNAVLFTVQ